MVLYLLALFAATTAHAEDLQYLDHSELALARLYNDISNATSTIDLSYLIWNPCSSAGKVITKLLGDKAHPKDKTQRPVKVRVLLDSFFQRDKLSAMQYELAKSGIDLKFFNGAMPISNFHTHSKLTLVDSDVPGKAQLVTGGRNIADEYFGMAKKNLVDRDVSVTGPSAKEDPRGTIAQAKSGFQRLWENPRVTSVAMPTAGEVASLKRCEKWNAKDASLDQYLKKNAAQIVAQEKPVSCQNVSFTVDDMSYASDPGIGGGLQRLADQLAGAHVVDRKPTSRAVYGLIAGAKHSLTLENQYFIPDDAYLEPLLKSKKAIPGFKTDVYSNMYDKDDGIESVFNQQDFDAVNLWQNEAMTRLNGGGETNHMNFRIAGALDRWRYSPPYTEYTYHAKTFVADHENAAVSSFNVDPRSMSINGESALVAKRCPAFAEKVEGTARLTGKVWTLEENLQVCLTGRRPVPPGMDPLTAVLELFTKELQ